MVIPTYNEAANLPKLAASVMALNIPGLGLLFVDDNSPDGTAEVAEALGAKYEGGVSLLRRPDKQGLGPAYRAGFAAALARGADYVVQMDADLSHSPEYLPVFLQKMADYDVVVGSRWTRGGGADGSWGLGRRLLSRGAAAYARLMLGLRVEDPTTGFKCFRNEALRGLQLETVGSHGFGFQVEVAFACQCKGYRVAEVPIIFRSRDEGRSKMSLAIIFEAFWRVIAIRFSRWHV